jgi:hypothetical protein
MYLNNRIQVDEEYQISDIYSLAYFTIFSSEIKIFLPLSRQTNDKFGNFFFFQIFKAFTPKPEMKAFIALLSDNIFNFQAK